MPKHRIEEKVHSLEDVGVTALLLRLGRKETEWDKTESKVSPSASPS